jgi:hypothetical protein
MCTRTKRSPPLPNRCLGRTRRGHWTSGGIHSCGAQTRCEAFQEQGQRHLRSLHTSTPVETKPSHSRHNCNQHCGNDRADLRQLQGPSLRAVLPGKVFVHPPSQNNYLGRTTTSYTRAHKLLFSVVMLHFISCMCTLLKCYVLVYSKLGLQSIRLQKRRKKHQPHQNPLTQTAAMAAIPYLYV